LRMDTRVDEPEQIAIKIVAFVDGSEPGDWAFHKALQYKRPEDELLVCNVIGNCNMWSPGLRYGHVEREDMEAFAKAQRQLGNTLCKAYTRHCHQHNIPRVSYEVISPQSIATPAQEAIWFLKHHKITDVFLGARGIAHACDPESALGSFSDYIMRHAKCTVHVIKKPAYEPRPLSPTKMSQIAAQLSQQDKIGSSEVKLSDPSTLFDIPQQNQESPRTSCETTERAFHEPKSEMNEEQDAREKDSFKEPQKFQEGQDKREQDDVNLAQDTHEKLSFEERPKPLEGHGSKLVQDTYEKAAPHQARG